MISAEDVAQELDRHGFGPCVGVPCSFLTPLIDYLIDQGPGRYLAANNEGEAVAIASGTCLAGRRPVVMFQNSGLGNAVSPLTSLAHTFRIPLLLITTWRGEPGMKDEPQHQLMGRITEPMLALLEISHAVMPAQRDGLRACFDAASEQLQRRNLPHALIVKGGTLLSYQRKGVTAGSPAVDTEREKSAGGFPRRSDAIRTIVEHAGADALLLATTGKAARELAAQHDDQRNFYVVGSMGCASSIALGVASSCPTRRVVVIDGDGAALMRLEAVASIGHFAPANLTHVVLDNESYESTGGQRTQSATVDFPRLAMSCGYRTATSASALALLAACVGETGRRDGPHLVHVRIAPGAGAMVGRPTLTPPDVAARFRAAIASRGHVGGRD